MTDEEIRKIAQVAAKEAVADLGEKLDERDERLERYIGALKEDTDHKFAVLLEYVKDIPEMKESIRKLEQDVGEMKPILEATFEQVGNLTIDMEVVKAAIQDHEQRLQKIEAR